MAVYRGDLDYYVDWLAADDKDAFERGNTHIPCVRHLYTFTSAFLFSVETQHTIGKAVTLVESFMILCWLFCLFRLWISTCH